MSGNCGNGRNIWATVDDGGKPAYGRYFDVGPKPRLMAVVESTRDLNSAKSVAFVTSSPNEASRSGVFAFRLRSAFASHHTPRFPTYAISIAKFWVISR